ncbi:MAG: hypothetical protein JSU05_03485 [Bacteroidetes bacterium]|nr:hypothetical protein [Bacteroidota bacterium]
MKAYQKHTTLIVFLFFALFKNGKAQTGLGKYELGGSLGTYIYQGDLTPSRLGSFKTMKPGLSLFGSRILSNSFSIRANLSFAHLKGDDSKYSTPAYRQLRNFYFTTPVTELSATAVWNVLGKNYTDGRTGRFSPYVFAGAGLSLVHIKRDWSRLDTHTFGATSDIQQGLNIDMQRSTPRVLPVLPVGAGVRYWLSPRIDIMAETSYRLMFTDYLDGFSYSANPNRNDHYHSTSVGIIYKLWNKNTLACPVLKY